MTKLHKMQPLVTLLQIAIVSYFCSTSIAQSNTYIVHMDKSAMPKPFSTHQTWFESTLSSLSSSSKLIHSYSNSLHGFSATLTPSELEALKSKPGFVHSTPDGLLNTHTTHTPKFLGLSTSSGIWPASSYGEGVVVGIIDSGVWPESKSFSDAGMNEVPSKWKGKCETGDGFNSSLCNKKLIGARFFNKGYLANGRKSKITIFSPRDDNGHGTHVASIAVGSRVDGASFFGYAPGTAVGMAPRAHLAVYKCVWLGSVYKSDFLAAADQAIEDGVDVLSISLGVRSDTHFLDDDAVAVATFAATERGIFIAASAGNDGPMLGYVINGAPWITTVAAGTIDRLLQGTVVLGNGVRIGFETLYPGNSSSAMLPLIFQEDCFSVEDLKRIIICMGMGDVEFVKINRVAGAVFITNETVPEYFSRSQFPAAFISPKEGEIVMSYVNTGKNPTARLEYKKTLLGITPAPKVDSYSSRGPFLGSPDILKPDILAPGSSILASWSPIRAVGRVRKRDLFSNFNIDSGTSMSVPHVAGVAALVKAVHRDWSPAAIRSALMTTANPVDNMGNVIGAVDGSKSLGLGIGSGHIDPNKAVDPGLIYDTTTEEYVKHLCGMNYTEKQIQVITKSSRKCVDRSLDLNYPSFIAYFNGVEKGLNASGRIVKEFRRTVTNVGGERSIYTAKLTEMSELRVKVEPLKLVFKKKYEKLSYKLSLEGPKVLRAESVLGSLRWVEDSGTHIVTTPIVATSIDPKSLPLPQ